MRTLKTVHNIPWLPVPNEMHLVADSIPPSTDLTTTAFAFAFDGDRLLLTNINGRGWSVPGGHIEPGETPEETVRREVAEEAGARLGPLRVLGYQLIRIAAPKPVGYRYPYPDSFQLFYLSTVSFLDPFRSTEEALARQLFSPAEAMTLPWVQRNRELYETALSAATQGGAA